MKIKEVKKLSSSATIIKVFFATDRNNAFNNKAYRTEHITDLWNASIYDELDVEFIYPGAKDILDVWVVTKVQAYKKDEILILDDRFHVRVIECNEGEDGKYYYTVVPTEFEAIPREVEQSRLKSWNGKSEWI